ncbi:MAG: helix-turn-helix domain-containing protein [Candidatus Dormibacteraceae bacterium]
MTQVAAAEILGVSRRRVRQLREEGRLRSEKIGRDWLVDAESVRAYAETARRSGKPRKEMIAIGCGGGKLSP